MYSRLVNIFKWIFTVPARWLGGARSWFGWSLPTRVALILLIFLLLCVLVYYAFAFFNPESPISQARGELPFNLALLLLLVAIPGASYFAVKSWLETEPSLFPDIDEAWHEGWNAVRRAGIEPNQTPIFFVFGVSTAKQADHMMEATELELAVKGEPEGRMPLRWYANEDSITVFLLDASATSKAQSIVGQVASEGSPGGGGLRGTLVGSAPGAPAAGAASGIRGTIISNADSASEPAAAPMQAAGGFRGTIVAGANEGSVLGAAPTSNQPAGILDRRMLSEQLERLSRVCKLAAESRQPLCPINGCIAVVEWEVLMRSQPGQLSGPLRDDVRTFIEASQIHTPMAVLISGLEDETGFTELVRRVGENRARENRFGHGYNHLAPMAPDQLSLLADHACGAFEDWIYDLFRHPDCLTRTKNDKLFALLCKMRSQAQTRVVELLSSLSGVPDSVDMRGPLLCGAYFGAAGSTRLRQAFIRSVFEKLFDLEEELEWTQDAIQRDNGYRSIARLLIGVNALLTIFIIGLIVFQVIR